MKLFTSPSIPNPSGSLFQLSSSKESKSGASSRSAGCQGSGMKISTRQIGPGNMSVCPECRGSAARRTLGCGIHR
ncbi:chaperone protein dnaJ 2-like isoform X3 [Papaver somniferum]|uniref:chaperone protein dnaJ 2-like isoform X3 n=1 Tax=Papaver somniferum TaxID=3469 RepID=UPI000E6FAFF4|nr:chaperone protein dnaJ 2-like isoform X3 [Papaver somniferum]